MKANLSFSGLIRVVALMLVALVSSISVFSQDQTVNAGSTYTYTATRSVVGSTYTWAISGVAGTNWSATLGTANTQAVTWLQTGTYTITVTEFNATCPDLTPTTYVVEVAASSIEFADLAEGPLCSDLTGNITIPLTITGTVDYPITVNVNIVANGNTFNNQNIIINSGADLVIVGATYAFGANSSTSDRNNTVTIVSCTDDNSGTVTVNTGGGVNVHTRNVYATPATSTITHD